MNDIKYGMSFEDYKQAAGVNASFLCEFKRSPAHGKAYLEEPRVETDAFKLGTLVHKFTLEPELAAHGIVTKPDGMDFRSKEGKEWKAANADKTILSLQEKKDLVGMTNSILTHPVASNLFAEGEPEVSMFADYNGILRKGRVDFLPGGNVIVDLKTCVDASPNAFSRDLFKFSYHIKAAYYLDIAKALGLDKEVFVLVCVEKTPPYAVKCYQIHLEAIRIGREVYRELLQQYAECVQKNHWPAYSEEIEVINLPAWALAKAA